jgi:pheromone shutdown protein TraB
LVAELLNRFCCSGKDIVEKQDDIVKTVYLGDTEVTLMGTAHVSRLSVEMVEEHIQNGDYDCVAVELCAPRLENLTTQAWWKNLDIYLVFG